MVSNTPSLVRNRVGWVKETDLSFGSCGGPFLPGVEMKTLGPRRRLDTVAPDSAAIFLFLGTISASPEPPGEWPLEVDCVLLHVLYSGHEDGPFTLTISGHWHPIHPHPATTLPAQVFHVGRQKSDWREKCAPGVSFQCLHSSCCKWHNWGHSYIKWSARLTQFVHPDSQWVALSWVEWV